MFFGVFVYLLGSDVLYNSEKTLDEKDRSMNQSISIRLAPSA